MAFNYKERTDTKITDHPVGKLLDSLHMESAFFTNSDLTSPWALSMPPMTNCMMFHLIIDGEVEFNVNDEPLLLKSGDFILFPRGEGHVLSDGQCNQITPLHDLPIKAITERYETLNFGGGGKRTKLVCGVMLFQHPLAIKILGILPDFIHISADANDSVSIVQQISDLLGAETQRIDVGAEAVIARLADILVIAAMRQYMQQLDNNELGWLNALLDDRIGKALQLIHAQPAKHWSLDELAESVAMSRTSFSQEFKRLVGNSPMDYLTEWRMSLAFSKLQLTNETQLAIALDVGYKSEASFSRAFKKVIGRNPGDIRKEYQLTF